jgi:PKD repeat protein
VAGFGSTNLVVRFVPVSEGTFSNSVFFTSNGGNPTNDLTGIGAIVPQANFSGAPTSGLAPLSVTFVDTSLGTITNRNWSFGDGSSTNTTSTNLLHSYLVAGTNTVRLIASGPLGASTNLRPAYIVVTNRPPQLFVTPSGRDFGVLTVGQTSSLPFQVINLGEVTLAGTATATGPFLVSGGSPYSVLGGQTGTVTVSFLPLTEGSFSNAVVFQSNGGASTNHLQGTAFFPPVANFLADPTNGAAPLLVTFTDQSTGVVTNRVWMFGDGTSTSTASSVTTHLYTLHRTNTVSLIAEGPGGASTNTKPDYIVVVVYPPGDLNGDFHVRGADSLLINQVLVGLRPTNSPIFAVTRYQNGDVNQDGAVAGQDSLLINQVVVDLRSYLVTKILPDSRSGSTPTPVTIYGVGFPTGTVSAVTIGPPVNLTLSNVVVVSEERIEAIVPMGGGLGTGTVTVIATPTNGVISFGRFINE